MGTGLHACSLGTWLVYGIFEMKVEDESLTGEDAAWVVAMACPYYQDVLRSKCGGTSMEPGVVITFYSDVWVYRDERLVGGFGMQI